VATAKIVVLRATLGAGPEDSLAFSESTGALSYAESRQCPRPTHQMANIESQRKRNARTERERQENRRLTSRVRTFFRRLESASEAGDSAAAATEHRELVSAIDRAVGRGAMHRNTGARRKARAARLLTPSS